MRDLRIAMAAPDPTVEKICGGEEATRTGSGIAVSYAPRPRLEESCLWWSRPWRPTRPTHLLRSLRDDRTASDFDTVEDVAPHDFESHGVSGVPSSGTFARAAPRIERNTLRVPRHEHSFIAGQRA